MDLCPTRALHNRVGALTFPKGDCVQCGLCVNACPEHALSVEPRQDSEALVARAERTLKAASEIFPCVVCGAPVGPRSLVEGSMAHVRDHPMFQGEGLRLLQMCKDCRQKAIRACPAPIPRPSANRKGRTSDDESNPREHHSWLKNAIDDMMM